MAMLENATNAAASTAMHFLDKLAPHLIPEVLKTSSEPTLVYPSNAFNPDTTRFKNEDFSSMKTTGSGDSTIDPTSGASGTSGTSESDEVYRIARDLKLPLTMVGNATFRELLLRYAQQLTQHDKDKSATDPGVLRNDVIYQIVDSKNPSAASEAKGLFEQVQDMVRTVTRWVDRIVNRPFDPGEAMIPKQNRQHCANEASRVVIDTSVKQIADGHHVGYAKHHAQPEPGLRWGGGCPSESGAASAGVG